MWYLCIYDYLGFYYEFYCSTTILTTDLFSLLLCLEQSYGSTGISVIIFPSDTPKFWRERGSSTSRDHYCYSPWFFLWKINSFPLLPSFTPQHQAWGVNWESASTFTSNIGKFRGIARYIYMLWRVARCGGCDAVLGWEQNTSEQWEERTTVKAGVSPDSICLSRKSSRHVGGKQFKTQDRVNVKILHWCVFNLGLCDLNFCSGGYDSGGCPTRVWPSWRWLSAPEWIRWKFAWNIKVACISQDCFRADD